MESDSSQNSNQLPNGRKKSSKSNKPSFSRKIPDVLLTTKYHKNYSGDFAQDKELFIKRCSNVLKEKFNNEARILIEKALDTVFELFKGVKRGDGSEFYTHFLETADIVFSKMHFTDVPTIVSAILHDAPEDMPDKITFNDIRRDFTPEIAEIVEGVTKITQDEEIVKSSEQTAPLSYDDKEIATIRKVFQLGAKNPKIFFVKIADRYHNITTLEGIPKKERRIEIAQQTLNVYFPLLKNFGNAYSLFNKIADELVDLCLQYIISEDLSVSKEMIKKLRMLHYKEMERFISLAEKNKIEEVLKGLFKNAIISAAHHNVFDLYEASKPDFEEIRTLYSHYYFVLTFTISPNVTISISEIERNLRSKFPLISSKSIIPSNIDDYLGVSGRISVAYYDVSIENEDFGIEIVFTNPSFEKAEQDVNLLEKFYKNFSMFYDYYEYQAFLEITEELVTMKMPKKNKIELLFSMMHKIHPEKHVKVNLLNNDQTYIMPEGSVPLDLAIKASEDYGRRFIAAKLYNKTNYSVSVPFDYVLQNNDTIELVLGEESIVQEEHLRKVYTLKAYSFLKKELERRKEKKQVEAIKRKHLDIFGVDGVGVSAKISNIAANLHVNFTDQVLHVIESTDPQKKFSGYLVVEYFDETQFNILLQEIMKLDNVLHLSIKDI